MAAPAKIAATFWDCGGVLLTNGWDHTERAQVIEHFGLNWDEFERRHAEANDAWERGKISLHEYLRRTVFYASRRFSEADFVAQMFAASQMLHPKLCEFLKKLRDLRAKGSYTGIYLLSNESKELMAYRLAEFGLGSIFDAFLVSAYIGLRKPEMAFYQCALDIVQQRPERCVFIDDREENVAAAEKLGIHGIQMETPQQTIAALAQLGIAAE